MNVCVYIYIYIYIYTNSFTVQKNHLYTVHYLSKVLGHSQKFVFLILKVLFLKKPVKLLFIILNTSLPEPH